MCPNCSYCPACGRRNYWPNTFQPYYVPPTIPWGGWYLQYPQGQLIGMTPTQTTVGTWQ